MTHAHPVRFVLSALLAGAVLLTGLASVSTATHATPILILAGDDTKTGGGTG